MGYNARCPFLRGKKNIAGSVGASWVMFFIPHHTNQNEKLNSIKHVQIYNKSERRRRKTCHDVNQRQEPIALPQQTLKLLRKELAGHWRLICHGRPRPATLGKSQTAVGRHGNAKCHGQPLDLTMKSMTLSLSWTHFHSKPWQTWHDQSRWHWAQCKYIPFASAHTTLDQHHCHPPPLSTCGVLVGIAASACPCSSFFAWDCFDARPCRGPSADVDTWAWKAPKKWQGRVGSQKALQVGKNVHTRSTAQGGGGSFQDRRPIVLIHGRQSELMDQKVAEALSVSLSLSISLSLCLSVSPSLYLSISLSLYLSVSLSLCLSVSLSLCLSVSLSLSLSIYLSIYLSLSLSISLSLSLPLYQSIYLPVFLSICPSIRLSVYLKGNNFVRLPSKAEIVRSKTSKSSETSPKGGTAPKRRNSASFLTFTSQKRGNSARLPSKIEKLSPQVTASYHCVLWLFHPISLKYCTCHEKVRPIANLIIWCSKMQPPLRTSASWPPNIVCPEPISRSAGSPRSPGNIGWSSGLLADRVKLKARTGGASSMYHIILHHIMLHCYFIYIYIYILFFWLGLEGEVFHCGRSVSLNSGGLICIYIYIYLYQYHAQLTNISSIFPQQSVTDPVNSFTRPPWDPVHLDLKGCHLPPRPSPRQR